MPEGAPAEPSPDTYSFPVEDLEVIYQAFRAQLANRSEQEIRLLYRALELQTTARVLHMFAVSDEQLEQLG